MIRHAEPNPARPGPARRWLAFVAVGGVLVVAGGAGCHGRSGPQPGGATTAKAQEARKQAETCAVDAVKSAAATQVAAHPELKKRNAFAAAMDRLHLFDKPVTVISTTVPPTPPPPPLPRPTLTPTPPVITERAEPPIRAAARATSPMVIRDRVVSEIPYRTEAEAEDRVLKDAQDRIERKLRELDPPVEYRPPLAVVKNEYVRRDSRVVRPPTEDEKAAIAKYGYGSDRVYVEYTVEVSAEQVRELRTRDRLVSALRVFGVVTAIALAGFLFLRLDEWTKGYLTSWLALGAAALGGGVVAALVIV
ncbi:MAG: hypothetical protein JWO38_7977 [Gemmataceae bacterium]|nr:hypothetical protein [Gemmataceae bacterium]